MMRPATLPNDRFWTLLAGILAIAFCWCMAVTYSQYQANLVFIADAGAFDYLCAGPLHGHFFRTPLGWEIDGNYLGAHFRPIILLITPFYYIHDGVMTYLTVQNLMLVLAGLPLALLARDLLKNDWLSLAVVFLYQTNHFVGRVHLSNHVEAMAFVGMFALFLAAHRRIIWLYVLSLLWVYCIKEDYGLWVMLYGATLFLTKDRKQWRWAAITMAAGVIMLASSMYFMKINGAAAWKVSDNNPTGHYASMGDSLGKVAVWLATHPIQTAIKVLKPELLWLYISVGIIALLDWRSIPLVIAGAAAFLVADTPLVNDLAFYYSYAAIPFLFLGVVRGGATLLQWRPETFPQRAWAIAGIYLLAGLIGFLLPKWPDNWHRFPFPVSDRQKLAGEIARTVIPPDAPVAAQYDLYSKVPNRPVKLPLWPEYVDRVDWLFIDQLGRAPDLVAEERRELNEKINTGAWKIAFEGDGYVVLERVSPPPAEGEPELPAESENNLETNKNEVSGDG